MNIRLDNKCALVTGANSGLGAAIALALAEAGAKVAINYVAHPEATDKLLQKIKKKRGKAISIQADVSAANAVGHVSENRQGLGRDRYSHQQCRH